MFKTEYTPLSELSPEFCNLPIPSYVDSERIGVNMERLASIATLGGFAADQVRIVSISGNTTKESVGIAGVSGDSALGSATRSATKAKVADFDYQKADSGIYQPIPLRVVLNSSEISDRVQRSAKPLREPKTWTGHVDHAVRRSVHNAVWKRMVGSMPPKMELRSSHLAVAYVAANLLPGVWSAPVLAQSIPDMVYLGLANSYQVAGMMKHNTPMREATFSLVPYVHIDRAIIATCRVLGGHIVKAL